MNKSILLVVLCTSLLISSISCAAEVKLEPDNAKMAKEAIVKLDEFTVQLKRLNDNLEGDLKVQLKEFVNQFDKLNKNLDRINPTVSQLLELNSNMSRLNEWLFTEGNKLTNSPMFGLARPKTKEKDK